MDTLQKPETARLLTKESPRDSLARLYREIGISAVAAALQVPEQKAKPVHVAYEDLPAILRGDDLAA